MAVVCWWWVNHPFSLLLLCSPQSSSTPCWWLAHQFNHTNLVWAPLQNNSCPNLDNLPFFLVCDDDGKLYFRYFFLSTTPIPPSKTSLWLQWVWWWMLPIPNLLQEMKVLMKSLFEPFFPFSFIDNWVGFGRNFVFDLVNRIFFLFVTFELELQKKSLNKESRRKVQKLQ